MINKPLISVIIPVYKAEKYIAECLDSVIAQTYSNIEIIVVNDGGGGILKNILNEYIEKDNRIKVITNTENKGTLLARKIGIENAKGEYFSFVDSDDIVDKLMLEIMQDVLHKSDADFVQCGLTLFWDTLPKQNNRKKYDIKLLSRKEILIKFIISEKISPPKGARIPGYLFNKLYKRKIIKNVNLPDIFMISSEDIFFNLRIFERVKKGVFIKNKLYYYRQRTNSSTTNVTKATIENNLFAEAQMYAKFYELYKSNVLSMQRLNLGFTKTVSKLIKRYYFSHLIIDNTKEQQQRIIDKLHIVKQNAKEAKAKIDKKWNYAMLLLIHARPFFNIIAVNTIKFVKRKHKMTKSVVHRKRELV